jgi:hypothetical protein
MLGTLVRGLRRINIDSPLHGGRVAAVLAQRPLRIRLTLRALGAIAVLCALSVSACEPPVPYCVEGDLVQCRCGGDNTYGYQRCDATGHFSGPCMCSPTLTPDASEPPLPSAPGDAGARE